MAQLFCKISIVVENDDPRNWNSMFIKTNSGKQFSIKRNNFGIYELYLQINDSCPENNYFNLSYVGKSFVLDIRDQIMSGKYDGNMFFRLVYETHNDTEINLYLQCN